MNVERATNDLITFENEGMGKFEVELHNQTITKCLFMANGKVENGVFDAKSWEFVEAVNKATTDLLRFREEGLGNLPAPLGHAPIKVQEEPNIKKDKS